MGILGLTPFLRKKYPQVIKNLPRRFELFSGKTIALYALFGYLPNCNLLIVHLHSDATLISQRFWYDRDPHPHRHIRSWYQLILETRKSGVKVICVFDGRGVNEAKRREVCTTFIHVVIQINRQLFTRSTDGERQEWFNLPAWSLNMDTFAG